MQNQSQVVEVQSESPNDVRTKRNRTRFDDLLCGYGPRSMTS